MEIYWYLTAPDGPQPWTASGSRAVTYPYLQQVARAVDHLGFTGALLATGAHDPWILGASLIPFTENFRFLIAIQPGLISPTLLAKMALTFSHLSKGRLLLNVVSGDANTLGAYGLNMSHDGRYALGDEFLSVLKPLLAGETVNFKGEYFDIREARLALPGGPQYAPPLWFGGSSEVAQEIAAKHVDTYLSWGETPPQAAEKIAQVRQRAAAHGRTLRFGIRLYVILRDTDEKAWAAVDELYAGMDDQAIANRQALAKNSDSVGQARMTALHGERRPQNARDLEIYPNLWAGIGLVRPGPGTAIVGSPDTVERVIKEYADAGIEVFILSGFPLLEEAYRFGEQVLPRLPVTRLPSQAVEADTEQRFTWGNLWDSPVASAEQPS
ncbi:LLM class flavin-dependent oxidoreductase [Pseudomonas sp. TH05]|uniref:LLM class flavin-dependent oxidoreductase n=1 Tax=unclassified Pseudomonas TaxID=196821 RepID=UPI0019118609|nr:MULTISPECIES: LLM class flavin-dependent oxidoreductase [unclassified Pseudomonas]MBK5541659.1 LLM class flavin-dependent oxidoreductase [Pseudomonas sp. TH07]MBK5555155.1 LLM class flavin-dependent oxidoreductase [Pseudomonas sp. TH05]